MATDPLVVYHAVVRLDGARLDRLVKELKPASQSTISRLIKRLAKQDMIHRVGYEWFPVLDLCSGAGTQLSQMTDLCSGTGTQLSQVKHSGTQLSQVKQNDVVLHPFENTTAAADPAGDWLGSEDEPLTEESRAIAGPSGAQKDFEEPAAPSRSLRAADSGANGSEANSTPVRDMFSLKNHPAVMRHIVQKVRKARSRHNRGEGAKWARAKAEGKHYHKKLVDKETIEDMVGLGDAMCRSVAHETWWADEARHVAEMTRLIPDWRQGYRKALRDLNMVGPLDEVSEAPDEELDEAAWRQALDDLEDPGTYGYAPIVATKPDEIDIWAEAVASAKPYVHEDMATMRAEQDQAQQAERNARFAANSARIEQEMAAERAAAVEEPVTPAPAPEAATEPPTCATLPEKIVWHIQHQPGGHDLTSLVAATGRNYDAVSRAVMGLVNGNSIRKVAGKWWMAARATEPTKEAA